MENMLMPDIPTAWKVMGGTVLEQHHEKCSYRVTKRGLLCECASIDAVMIFADMFRKQLASAKKGLIAEIEGDIECLVSVENNKSHNMAVLRLKNLDFDKTKSELIEEFDKRFTLKNNKKKDGMMTVAEVQDILKRVRILIKEKGEK